MALTYRQVAQLVASALPHESRGVWATMTAIARCESTFDPSAVGGGFGLWQQDEGQGRALFDPTTAARHMAATYTSQKGRAIHLPNGRTATDGLGYWGCGPDHKAGYLLFLAPATAAVATLPSGPGGTQRTFGLTKRQTWAARKQLLACFALAKIDAFGQIISGDFTKCTADAVTKCQKAGGSKSACTSYVKTWGDRYIRANHPGGLAEAGACINMLELGPVHFCLDTVIGGAKVAAGGFLMVVGGMALVFVLSRDVSGATAVTRAVAKATPTGTYRSVRRSAKVRGTSRASYRKGITAGRARLEREQRAEFNRAERRGDFPAEEPSGFNTRAQLSEGRRRPSPRVRDRVGSSA